MLALLDDLLEAAVHVRKNLALAVPIAVAKKKLSAAFRVQGTAVVNALVAIRMGFPLAEVAEPDWQPFFDAALLETLQAFTGPIDELAASSLSLGANAALARLDIGTSFDLANPRAVSYLRRYGADRVRQINETTRQELRRIIVEGIDQGWGYDRIARAITDRYREFAVGRPQEHIQSRAHLIAVTEAGDAYEAGHLIVAEDLAAGGLPIEKSWLTAGDSRVDTALCAGNAAQGWIPLHQPFQSGHQRPLAHPACRCTLLTRRRGEPI